MQSKLSKLQKSILTFLYEGPLSVRELICRLQPEPTHGFENSVYKSLDSLEKRGLVTGYSVEKYRKTISLTDEGMENAREILTINEDLIHFQVTKQKLKTLLKKLSTNRLFKETIVLINDNTFISVHRHPHGNAIRYFKANSHFFKDISGDGLFVFPIEDVLNYITGFPQKELIDFEISDNILKLITSDDTQSEFICKRPDDIFQSLPYTWEEDFNIYTNINPFFDVHFKMNISLFKRIIESLKKLDTGLLSMRMMDSIISFRLGSFNHITMNPKVKIVKGNNFRVTLNNGFSSLKNVFDTDLLIKTGSDMPTLFSESTKGYEFGLLVPPVFTSSIIDNYFLNKIHRIDCFKGFSFIPDNSIDLILTDPPYNIKLKDTIELEGKTIYKNLSQMEWDKVNIKELYDRLFPYLDRIVKPDGSVLMFCRLENVTYLIDSAKKNNFDVKATIIWHKTNPVPQIRKRNYRSSTEAIVWVARWHDDKCLFKFNFKSQREMHNFIEHPLCNGKERTAHPTQKPLKIIRDLVEKHSNRDDVVLDPFMGSGTTAVACKLTGRKFIGFELNEEYMKMAEKRLGKIAG